MWPDWYYEKGGVTVLPTGLIEVQKSKWSIQQ